MTWQLHTGTGAPGTIAGQSDGDNYIDTDTGDIYQLVGTAWSLCMSFPGLYTTPPGDTTKFWRGDASWAVPPGGSGGDVAGPASATADNLASFDGVTGKIIKDSGSKASDFAVSAKGVTNGDSHDHSGGDGAAIPEAGLSLSDNTTGDVSTAKHGFAPKAPNDTAKYLRGDGTWAAVPAGSGTEKQVTIANNSSDASHDIDFSAGWMYDSTGVYKMLLSSTMTKRIDASWAAGTGNGGLFSGTVANHTWYYCFIIRKDSDGSIDAGFDTSVTAANIPSGYTAYRRVGAFRTDSSANIIGFHQHGIEFWYDLQIAAYKATNPGTSSVTVTLNDVMPSSEAILNVALTADNVLSTRVYLVVQPTWGTTSPSSSIFLLTAHQNNPTTSSCQIRVPVDSSREIKYQVSFSASETKVGMTILGWVDYGLLWSL